MIMFHPAHTEYATKPTKASWRPSRLASAIIVAVLVIAAGTYLADQYLAATQPKALTDLPQYPYTGSALAFTTLTAQQQAETEATLRTVANNVQPGYHVSSQRLLAATGEFVWDAVRSSVGGFLSPNGFHIQSAGQSPDTASDTAYIVWARTSRLQTFFNNRRLVTVGAQQPVRSGAPGPEVHVYGYFDLTPNS